MTEKIQAVIFDMGGVLLRSEDYGPREALAKEYGLTRRELEDIVFDSESAKIATIGKIDTREHWQSVFNLLKVPAEKQKAFEDAFWHGDQLDQSLVQFLRSLRPQYKTALLSNAWSEARDKLTIQYPCIDVFDIAVFSFEVGMAKPDPEIYHLVLERIGVKPEAAIFLDDFLINIQSASEVGIHAIHFHSAAQAMEEIRKLL